MVLVSEKLNYTSFSSFSLPLQAIYVFAVLTADPHER